MKVKATEFHRIPVNAKQVILIVLIKADIQTDSRMVGHADRPQYMYT